MTGGDLFADWAIPIIALLIAGGGLFWRIRANYRREMHQANEATEKQQKERIEAIEKRLNERIDEVQDDLRKANDNILRMNNALGEVTGLLKGYVNQAGGPI